VSGILRAHCNGHEVREMKPAYFAIGLSMLVGCAAPFGETADQGDDSAPEQSVKSADENGALDALRSRAQEDFASAPALRGHEIIVVASRIESGPDQIAIQAHVMKRSPQGKAMELTDADFVGAVDGDIKVTSPWRSEVTAIVITDGNGHWSTLKKGMLSSRAVEAYVAGQSPDRFEGWAQTFRPGHVYAKRTKF